MVGNPKVAVPQLDERSIEYYESQFEKRFRSRPGLSVDQRRAVQDERMKWMFLCVDPDTFGGLPEPPEHVRVAFREVFGSRDVVNNTRVLKLRMHPILKRWCLWELGRTRDNADHIWHCVWVCGSLECPHENYVPSDYSSEPLLHHFAGLVGEYRLPTRDDFEMLDRFDRVKYGADAVENYQIEMENAITRAQESEFEAFTHDFVHYHAHMLADEANQRAGSMQKTWMTMENLSERFRCNPAFYVVEQKKGFKIRRKRTKQEWDHFKRWAVRRVLHGQDDTLLFGMTREAFRRKYDVKSMDTERTIPELPFTKEQVQAMDEEFRAYRQQQMEEQAEDSRKRAVLRAAATPVAAMEVQRGNS